MDTSYDRKFEEMKKYTPFLESMIKRLESTGSTTENPRQAQLVKIRSLRDLLLDKKKRMKMENLLKCEQVLINLYAKVEKRDSFSDAKSDIETTLNTNNSQLNFARNKLKNEGSHLQDTETLPEIARACKREDVCMVGSKEPALFQRRPNKSSISPIRCPVPDNKKTTSASSKRSYTRVLVSPEHDPDGWPGDRTSHKLIFSRRSSQHSPMKSLIKQSPPCNSKGRKLEPCNSQKPSEQLNDLNITLKVPEESLNSLNTKDILSRIINCSDSDVDIDTLRGLRSQIISELKQTGTKDDISDLILKSYKKKKSKDKKRAEVEEGELSDSESEVIKSVYGSLVVVDADESNVKDVKKINENEQESRKIQICLVINSEKEDGNNESEALKDSCSNYTLFDQSDFEPFQSGNKNSKVKQRELKELKNSKKKNVCVLELEENLCSEKSKSQKNEFKITEAQQSCSRDDKVQLYDVQTGNQQLVMMESDIQTNEVCAIIAHTSEVPVVSNQTGEFQALKIKTDEVQVGNNYQAEEDKTSEICVSKVSIATLHTDNNRETDGADNSNYNATNTSNKRVLNTGAEAKLDKGFSPNFYKPILNQDDSNDVASSTPSFNTNMKSEKKCEYDGNRNCKDSVEIPLLDIETTAKQEVVQEIVILQALKNEILSEIIAMSDHEIDTPPLLHQPILTKVDNMHSILPKKRISIENYKDKSTSALRQPLIINDPNCNTTKDDLLKKQSLKLTDKEYERFNLSGKIALEESTDDEDTGKISPVADIYSNLAPKSPDHEDFADTGIKPPVIIPADPVKATVVSSKTDVDMRMMSMSSSTNSTKVGSRQPSPSPFFDASKNEADLNVNDKRFPLVDPRMKRDFNYPNEESPNLGFAELTLRPPINFPSGITPVMMPNPMSNMTPNRIPQTSNIIPNKVPNVTAHANVYEINCSRHSSENDGCPSQNHVYASVFPIHETHDFTDYVKTRDDLRNNSEFPKMYVDNNNSPIYNLSECPQTPVHPFGLSECATNPNHTFPRLEKPVTSVHPFGRSEAPMTPVHPFGRSEAPMTPVHPFGRSEAPMTPVHPFGRSEAPMTPVHSFGRSEAPMTPVHPFGRLEAPMTPVHPFGRSEAPMTPVHPFGRSEAPMTPVHPFGRSEAPMTPVHPFGRSEAPMTPVHPFGRSEAPMTPVHPFGRSEAPMTPVHPFGRSEAPMTPVHPFGRSEAPMAPLHSFGRSEAPMTPIHPFGRSDCPSTQSHSFGRTEVLMTPTHPFGRNDLSKNQSQIPPIRYSNIQDPRLNRSSDYDNKPRYNDEKSYDNYKERVSSNLSRRNNYKYNQSKLNHPDSFRSYSKQKNVGRYENRSTAYEQESQYGSSHHESGVGHSSVRSNKADRNYGNDRTKVYRQRDYRYETDSVRSFSDQSIQRRNYRREHSTGRTFLENRYAERKNDTIFTSDKTLSVHSHAGRSFTIDTSVNRSFQETFSNLGNSTLSESNFDARRKRASSVGRFLTKKPAVENSLSDVDSKHRSIRVQSNFRRACSVGRDSVRYNTTKNLSDIKEELQAFKNSSVGRINNSKDLSIQRNTVASKKGNERDPRLSKREQYDIKKSKNESLSTSALREHPRELILSRRDVNKNNEKKKPTDLVKEKSHEIKKHGIIYSTNNIAKGILGTGYGVKNYKIPKIKKPEEITNEDVADDDIKTLNDKKVTNTCVKKITAENREINFVNQECSDVQVEINLEAEKKENSAELESAGDNGIVNINSSSNIEKRVTRSTTRSIISEMNVKVCESPQRKINKSKKSVLQVSDSDDDDLPIINLNNNSRNEIIKEQEIINALAPTADDTNSISSNNAIKINVDNLGDSAVNNVTMKTDEPETLQNPDVNENNSIASDNCFGIELEMFSENIATDPVIENINALIADLDDDLDTSKNDHFKNQFTKEINLENMLDNITVVEKKGTASSCCETKDFAENDDNLMINKITQEEKLENNIKTEQVQQCADTKMEHNNEVTTSDQEMPSMFQSKSAIQISLGSCSVPDSTIEVNTKSSHETTVHAKVNEEVPDSTQGLISQINSDVTSSDNLSEVNSIKISSTRELQQHSDSMGSLLSILKDKTKIKELLSMLKDQSSENEKLKKKLEKLSEIVSDDDDDDDGKQIPYVLSNLSHTSDNSLNKDNGEEVDQCKVSALNNYSKDSLVDNRNQILNTQLDKEIGSINHSKSINSSLSSQLVNLEEEKIEEVRKVEGEQIADVTEKSSGNESKIIEDDKVGDVLNTIESVEYGASKKTFTKNFKSHRGKGKFKNNKIDENKRFTRSESTAAKIEKQLGVKVPSRELKQLQEDIKEMFMHDDMFNATGIRMCRLAKLVEDKSQKGEQHNAENTSPAAGDIISKGKTFKKKNESKSKVSQKNPSIDIENSITNFLPESKNASTKYKPGPRSKTKVRQQCEVDPYKFESDSVSESNHTNVSESKSDATSESECDSLGSCRSFESTEQTIDLKKKPKRKRRGWQAGVIKPKQKKKKVDMIKSETEMSSSENHSRGALGMPDTTCFTDKSYCFSKKVTNYLCKFCSYDGNEIVHHYKKQHPHLEIPLSRMSPEVAKEAIEQSEELNTSAVSKMPTDKYICRFCFKEFSKKKTILEAFFWHVVSAHTGEYKQLCSECINVEKCPFDLDIPPPPKELKGQLLGFICGKCNFTQISLENLKSHVITRHNNEQTEVSVINLAVVSKTTLLSLTNSTAELEPRRSRRLVQSITVKELDPNVDSEVFTETETSITNYNRMKSQITFENDDEDNEKCELNKVPEIKLESEEEMIAEHDMQFEGTLTTDSNQRSPAEEPTTAEEPNATAGSDGVGASDCYVTASNDVLDYPHFKMCYTAAGTKEYVCCINGIENHYVTALLISFKKHVQIKHKEKWDGFCFICKLIVTSQGVHYFKDCLQHFLDKHMDEFPIIEKENKCVVAQAYDATQTQCKNYWNVEPQSEIFGQSSSEQHEPSLPVIESVVSLGAPPERAPDLGESETNTKNEMNKYEEAQAHIMNKKYYVVLNTMMSHEKLVHLFKCAGRFCSYSSDNAEDALRHALFHERMGGENSLVCAYCGFDSLNNSVDLVTHVFKFHGGCPYACAQCFYRAAASQLVHAHTLRKHAQPTAPTAPTAEPCLVLRSTVDSPSALNNTILPREVAVPFLICNQVVNEERCKFKTYTMGKFYEHYRSRHPADDEYSCYCCSVDFPRYADLLRHIKSHGFKLYQCTWCVHGADTEAQLLAHASEKHPNKQPQAYLRVITNKDGAAAYRVLPLAKLNHAKVPTIDVTCSTIKGNPEQEAKRSLDLETLIVQSTRKTSESQAPTTKSSSKEKVTHSEALDVPVKYEPLDESQESLGLAFQCTLLREAQEASIQSSADLHRSKTPVLIEQSAENDAFRQLTPVLTFKPEQNSFNEINENEIIVCLDSDDEPSNQDVELPGNDPPLTDEHSQPEKLSLIPLASLFKCGLCKGAAFENAADFSRHVAGLHPQVRQLPCAYCSFRGTKKDVINHCSFEHSANESRQYICGVCNNKYISLVFAKRHIREAHKSAKVVVTSKTITDGNQQFIVAQVARNKKPSKRKKSNEHEDKTTQPAAKVKKFGPDELNLLPINPILDDLVYCALCEFGTKVRLNMVRHLQLHAEQQPVPQTAPVNPVPHLENNEKHFDKMLNLASSSIGSRMDKSNRSEPQGAAGSLVPPEAAARYPKYVPDRQRYTCGARDCSYISVDEVMLKYHWETLHSGTNDFHCVHCPPHQHLDTSKQLTASRIIAHLKMHDVKLYACPCCLYYHHRRQAVEKHIAETHKAGQVMVVREDPTAPVPNVIATSTATPTMDLKPWQCGLCKFKSMLRPEVVEHCAKIHQSKMQYKCMYCAFRTSVLESVQKHQRNAHPDRALETFYFYYREGSIPNESNGTPRWQKQCQNSVAETVVKSEVIERTDTKLQSESSKTDLSTPTEPVVDLNIVKEDPDAVVVPEHLRPEVCGSFDQFCEPDGSKYKCPLCKIVSEESKEAMQSHLYEELRCRKWECGFCSYRAFHKKGLNEHMISEHRQNCDPIELPVDSRVETWIAKALDYQFLLIEKNKQNLAKQRMSSNVIPPPPPVHTVTVGPEPLEKYTINALENAFGKFGASDDLNYKCPKCSICISEENAMRDHLEMELNKIRWCCNKCTEKFQNYHEAQFHCKTAHAVPARADEAVRDMAMRSAWISAVVESQKLSMNNPPAPGADAVELPRISSALDNSLLVVRYEENIPTPEVPALSMRASSLDSDEDEEKLVIDEPSQNSSKVCPFCLFVSKDFKDFKDHLAQHDTIKPYFCSSCDFNSYRKAVLKHIGAEHGGQTARVLTKTQRSRGPPLRSVVPDAVAAAPSPPSPPSPLEDDTARLVCLICEKSLTENEAKNHTHEYGKPAFAKKGQVVVKCCICLRLHESVEAVSAHHLASHPAESLNYAYYKLHCNKRCIYRCDYCEQHFNFWRDLNVHWKATHSSLPLKYSKRLFGGTTGDAAVSVGVGVGLSDDEIGGKGNGDGAPGGTAHKTCARKSTTKLPFRSVAKKSTSRLPYHPKPELGEYSFYGTRPTASGLDDVRTNLAFGCTDVSFSFRQLSDMINIAPTVLVWDLFQGRGRGRGRGNDTAQHRRSPPTSLP